MIVGYWYDMVLVWYRSQKEKKQGKPNEMCCWFYSNPQCTHPLLLAPAGSSCPRCLLRRFWSPTNVNAIWYSAAYLVVHYPSRITSCLSGTRMYSVLLLPARQGCHRTDGMVWLGMAWHSIAWHIFVELPRLRRNDNGLTKHATLRNGNPVLVTNYWWQTTAIL